MDGFISLKKTTRIQNKPQIFVFSPKFYSPNYAPPPLIKDLLSHSAAGGQTFVSRLFVGNLKGLRLFFWFLYPQLHFLFYEHQKVAQNEKNPQFILAPSLFKKTKFFLAFSQTLFFWQKGSFPNLGAVGTETPFSPVGPQNPKKPPGAAPHRGKWGGDILYRHGGAQKRKNKNTKLLKN